MLELAYMLSIKPLFFVGSSREDLKGFPEDVQDATGYALYIAQTGGKHPHAKALRGFGGAGVLEVMENHAGDTYRTVYTVRLQHAVYVLHAFQKKSRRGIETPREEIDLVRARLRLAEEHHNRSILEGGKS
jgi:phage-related protein